MRGTRPLVGAVLFAALACTAGCSSSQEPGPSNTPAALSSDQLIEQWLESEAAALGIENPPRVDPVRAVSPAEFATVQIQCMREEGFDARLTLDGEGVDYSAIPPEQTDQLRVAIYMCESKYPIGAVYLVPLNENQLRALYEYRSGELSSCIVERGFTPSTAPSLTAFVETDGQWSPYDQLIELLPPAELTELMQACPQSPTLEALFPG